MSLIRDLRSSLRALARSPLFTSVAVLSLALGIGANTAIFSLVDQLLLRMLPVDKPEELVMIYPQGFHAGNNMGTRMSSYPMYQDFQKQAAPFSQVLCRRFTPLTMTYENQSERVQGELVSGNYFTMLGVRPAVGRLFSSEQDDRVYKGHLSVVLSHPYWVARFAADPNIVGKKIRVNNYPLEVVGVAAPGFAGLDPTISPQMFVPVLISPLMMPGRDDLANRRSQWVQVFARLKPGFTPEKAQSALQTLFLQIRRMELTLPQMAQLPEFYRNRFLQAEIQVEPAAGGFSSTRESFALALKVLMAMVGLVLLIACLNVANLLIARGLARSKEVATRLAVGASRWQLVRPLLFESLVLSLIGAAAGIPLAYATVAGLLRLLPEGDSILMLTAAPDLRILAFTIAVSVFTGLLFGMTPALQTVRVDPWTTLKDAAASTTAGGGSVRLRKTLVALQVTFSFLLLIGAGLFVRSLGNLKNMNTGFRDMDNLVSFRIDPDLNGYTIPRIKEQTRKVLEAIRATPGVTSASTALVPLLSGDEWDSSMSVEGHRMKDGEDMQAFMNMISPDYWKTMGIPMLDGRDFDDRDVGEEPRVAIVNRKFAEHFFGSPSAAVGRRIGFGTRPNTELKIQIVGVAEDTLYEGPREGVHRQVFVPFQQLQFPASTGFYVRAGIESSALMATLRGVVARVDPALPVSRMETLEGRLDSTLSAERLTATLSTVFGILATVLAAIGLYGVMAFAVARRTRELGLRMALGAQPHSIILRVFREIAALLVLGLAVGIPASYALSKYVSSQLFGLEGVDYTALIAAAVVLSAVALLAGFLPARRASTIDPNRALRYE